MSKHDQLLAILWLLQSGKKITAQEIANRFELNIRTVYRYIDTLSMSGVPIIAEPGHQGGYSLPKDSLEAPLLFTTHEQTALHHASTFAMQAGYYDRDTLQRVLSKVNNHSNARQREKQADELNHIDLIDEPTLPDDAIRQLNMIEQAISTRTTVQMTYSSPKHDGKSVRLLDPYQLIHWKNAWYVIGHCHNHHAIRSFKVERIVSLQLTDHEFTRPLDFSGSSSFFEGLLPRTGDIELTTDIVLAGTESSIQHISEHWYLKNCVIEQTQHQITFRVEAKVGYEHLPRLLLPYQQSLRILHPTSLRNRMIEELTALIHFHQSVQLH